MDKRLLLGVDIGGTKCAVTLGESENDGITIRDKEDFETTGVNETIAGIKAAIWEVLKRNAVSNKEIDAIGVSCGGPLNGMMKRRSFGLPVRRMKMIRRHYT